MSSRSHSSEGLGRPATARDLIEETGERKAVSVYLTRNQRIVLRGLSRLRNGDRDTKSSMSVTVRDLLFSGLDDETVRAAWTEGAVVEAIADGDLELALNLKVLQGFAQQSPK